MRIEWPLVLVHFHAVLQFQHIKHRITGDFAEQRMLILQFRGLAQCEEELRCIIISARVRHRQQTTSNESQTRMKLILERSAVHRITAAAIAVRIAALHDEAFDQTMENCVVVVALHAELNEIAACFRSFPAPELDVDIADRCFQQNLSGGMKI